MARFTLTSAACLLLVACAGHGGDDEIVRDGGEAPTFGRVWNDVLSAKACANPFCHGLAFQGELSMSDRETAYASLVGVMAAGPECGTSGKVRVVPGDPEHSLIVDKLSHAVPACGSSMPPGSQLAPNCDRPDEPRVCNTPQEIQLVIDWIAAGAKND